MGLKPFEQLVAEHGPTVLRVCRAVLGYHEAEDAWSETFLAALRAYPDLAPDTNVQAWLVTIAKRKAIDQHRSAKRNPLPVNDLPEESGHDDIVGERGGELWPAPEVTAAQAAGGDRVSPSCRAAVRGGRHHPRQFRGGGPPGCRRRHQETSRQLPREYPDEHLHERNLRRGGRLRPVRLAAGDRRGRQPPPARPAGRCGRGGRAARRRLPHAGHPGRTAAARGD